MVTRWKWPGHPAAQLDRGRHARQGSAAVVALVVVWSSARPSVIEMFMFGIASRGRSPRGAAAVVTSRGDRRAAQ